ncbi:heme lyase CcmF/NrfE family subunit [Candidatus Tokpelaia sp.]|uniref:heme lyase CcmF/NrfE family subunit n=1 Tax=Candidatus Tokpelaia sp. TaxID=2233777 RepID=UPI00123C2825|nr:heme lyase CcmF/NrfE family subunit [Candidatus Tokpelaia sp.]KAA6405922.1 heme lyase NrfEFG subunit NrfE [Candidatus Tokpelaia sp.]
MIIECGHFLLILALAVSLYQAVVPLIGWFCGDIIAMRSARFTAIMVFALVALSYAALTYAYVISDFSVMNVAQNSHSEKPLFFKITGVWGNHEGSMLLWVLILTFFSALVAVFGKNLPLNLAALVLVCQSFIAGAFLAFILFTSNPFARLLPPALQGRDLNPVLQDVGLALHPPMLYLGYVGFSVCFSFAIAALLCGRVDAAFGRWVRPWALLSWFCLTWGITAGSYWAYYELGWGGYWFWDPVENASLMPWLSGTALLHSALVLEKRSALKIWTVLLAIITFSFSLLGTFLVRSGILTSVHSFATDPARGLAILAILGFFIGCALLLFAFRAPAIKNSGLFRPVSRESALILNNLFLMAAAATVLAGTLYPLLVESLTGEKISVGAPFFNLTIGALFLPLLLIVPFGPLLGWKRGDIAAAAERLWLAFAAAIAAFALTLYLDHGKAVLAAAGIGLAFWAIFGALTDLISKSGGWKTPLSARARRLKNLPAAFWGTAFAHMGLGVSLFGIIAVAGFEQEYIGNLAPGQAVDLAGNKVVFDGYKSENRDNFQENRLYFTIKHQGKILGQVTASRRFFPSQNAQTTETGLFNRGFSQYYIAPGDYNKDGSAVLHIWWKPNVLCIWLGGLLMMTGAVLSLADRRRQRGAPAGKKVKPAAGANLPERVAREA